MILRAILIFMACVLIGTIGTPYLMWAAAGSPSGDSHGLSVILPVGLYKGFTGGFVVGLFAALISLCRKPEEKDDSNEEDKK